MRDSDSTVISDSVSSVRRDSDSTVIRDTVVAAL